MTYSTVTTGDVITVYIINYAGYIGTGAATVYYDIYHYDTVKDKMLTTDEFLAYYAEGQFADYKVADIVAFMNEHEFSAYEADNVLCVCTLASAPSQYVSALNAEFA